MKHLKVNPLIRKTATAISLIALIAVSARAIDGVKGAHYRPHFVDFVPVKIQRPAPLKPVCEHKIEDKLFYLKRFLSDGLSCPVPSSQAMNNFEQPLRL